MEIDILGIALRWLHIMAAITLFGGLIFRAVALMPASQELDEAQREKLEDAVRRRWAKFVGISALLLIATGAWNLVRFIQEYGAIRGNAGLNPAEQELLRVPEWYTPLLGAKIGLALVIFFLASLLSGRGRVAQKLRANPKPWVCLTAVLATVLVAMSSTLRSTHAGPNVKDVIEVAVDENPPPVFKPGETQETPPTKVEEAPAGLDFSPPTLPE